MPDHPILRTGVLIAWVTTAALGAATAISAALNDAHVVHRGPVGHRGAELSVPTAP